MSAAAFTLEEKAEILRTLTQINERLNAVFPSVQLPADAIAATSARAAATARGFFWTAEFAAVIGREKQFVSDRCSARVIKTLPGGKPYRIPLTEEARWNRAND